MSRQAVDTERVRVTAEAIAQEAGAVIRARFPRTALRQVDFKGAVNESSGNTGVRIILFEIKECNARGGFKTAHPDRGR